MITDGLNKLIIFETSVEMNNKYDTKQFADMMEKLNLDPDKLIQNEEEKDEDKYKVKHKINGDLLWSSAFD